MIKAVPVKDLQPGHRTKTAIFLEDGRLLLSAGSRLSERHIKILERSGIKQVIACDKEAEGLDLGEPADSRPVDVKILKVGSVVSLPFYTENGFLLLSPGSVFTQDHKQALQRNGIKKVYARGPGTLLPNLGYIQALAETIAIDCDRLAEKNSAIIMGQHRGPGWSATINTQTTNRRTAQIITQTRNSYDEKINLVEDLFSRILKNRQIKETALLETALALMNMLEKDKTLLLCLTAHARPEHHFIFRHSLNTAVYSMAIASQLRLSNRQVLDLVIAALIEDIGMMVVPQTILNLDRPLLPEEKNIVSRHVFNSLGLQSNLNFLSETIRLAIYQHHERNNASGYPKKTQSENICEFAKILAVSDSFSALISNRPHRKGLEPYRAVEKLIRLAAQNILCKQCVKAFLDAVSLFPIGSFVQLSNKYIGQVIATTGHYAQPIVRVLFDEQKKPLEKDYILNLEETSDIFVSETFSAGELNVDTTAGF